MRAWWPAAGPIRRSCREAPAPPATWPPPRARGAVSSSRSPGDFVECPVYDRRRLGAGHVIAGPAVVEQFDSTTLIHPGQRAEVDDLGFLLIEA